MAEIKPSKPHGNRKDITGLRFGKLTVIRCAGARSNKLLWECRCDCGTVKLIIGGNITRGLQLSCGCQRIESATTHGKAHSREYTSWEAAKGRCLNPNNEKFSYYGGRGITMFDGWINSFQAFFDHIGPRPAGTTLDRIDNDKGYEPGNVRWSTHAVQQNNLRSNRRVEYDGRLVTLQELSQLTGIGLNTLASRYHGHTSTPLLDKPDRHRPKPRNK